jgi:hypothetical protein
MSTTEQTVADLREQFLNGEIGPDELRERLRDLDEETDREELWARWASQGLFDDPIAQEGYLSLADGDPEYITDDG